MREVIWNSLVASLQSGQCVLVLGPDISAEKPDAFGGMVSAATNIRDDFCDNLAQQLEEENQKVGERVLFAIAQQYEDYPAFSTVNLKNLAAGFFRNSGHVPGSLHKGLARCPFSVVLTTCYDDIFAKELKDQGKAPVRYWYHYRGEPRDNRELEGRPEQDSPAIYHLFGTYDEPNSLVLTENDLLDFAIHLISGCPELPNSLKNILRDKTFLFVGFGIRHWYIRVLLKLMIRKLDLAGGSIALESLCDLNEQEKEQTVLFYKRGTRVEVVDMEALAFIEELWTRFEKGGGYLGPAKRRGRRAQLFISYERSDESVAKRLFEALPKEQFEAWLDAQMLQVGEDWNSVLEEKIRSCDYFMVLNSENLVNKLVGYVNKEMALALDLKKYRQQGLKFIIPILVGEITAEAGRQELRDVEQYPLRPEVFDDDLAKIVRTLSRDFQRRMVHYG